MSGIQGILPLQFHELNYRIFTCLGAQKPSPIGDYLYKKKNFKSQAYFSTKSNIYPQKTTNTNQVIDNQSIKASQLNEKFVDKHKSF